jgi:hypothetical protein
MKRKKIEEKLKSEKGMTNVQLAITVIIIIVIAGCTIFLTIGEKGFSISPKIENEENENIVNNENIQENNIDNTVYGG